jgi:hypothetical protein
MQNLFFQTQNYKERKISVKKAIAILGQNNMHVNEHEAAIILDFLYLIAKSYKPPGGIDLKETSNSRIGAKCNDIRINRSNQNLV